MIQTARFSKSYAQTLSRYFYAGQRNAFGQAYSIRNCHFEPATYVGGERVGSLMKQVDKAFSSHKLAVFSSHRINYVGGIDEENRSRTLLLLDDFLTSLLKKYPDTVFLSSDQLIDIFG